MSSSVVGQAEEAIDVSLKSPGTKKEEKRSSFFSRLVGCSNVGDIVINGQETSGLVDTGSQITSVSESFYNPWTLFQS